MRNAIRYGGIVLIALLLMSCALVNSATNLVGGKSTQVADMWSDVPVMDGMTRSNEAMPLATKVAIQTMFSAAGGGAGSIDFISYKTDRTPAQLTEYYTVERMTQSGWNNSEQIGCSDLSSVTGTDTVGADGVGCLFAKQEGDNQGSVLAILGVPDSKSGQMTVFFARVRLEDLHGTPTP